VNYERRRAPRHAFAAIAEVIGMPHGVRVGRVKDLSLQGAYVALSDPFPANAQVQVALSTEHLVFRCQGTVAYSSKGIGMGISFREVLPASQAVLEEWLRESKRETLESDKSDLE